MDVPRIRRSQNLFPPTFRSCQCSTKSCHVGRVRVIAVPDVDLKSNLRIKGHLGWGGVCRRLALREIGTCNEGERGRLMGLRFIRGFLSAKREETDEDLYAVPPRLATTNLRGHLNWQPSLSTRSSSRSRVCRYSIRPTSGPRRGPRSRLRSSPPLWLTPAGSGGFRIPFLST